MLLGEPPGALSLFNDSEEKKCDGPDSPASLTGSGGNGAGNENKRSNSSSSIQLNECAIETLRNVIGYHSSHWPSLALNVDIPETKL